MTTSNDSSPIESLQMRSLCEAYQLGIIIRNKLRETNLVTAFENLDHSIDRLKTGIQRGILRHFPFARWCSRSCSWR